MASPRKTLKRSRSRSRSKSREPTESQYVPITPQMKNTFFCTYNEETSRYERIEYEDDDYVFPRGVTRNQKSPGLELYEATDKAYNIKDANGHDKILHLFNKENNNWFKFVLISIKGREKFYYVRGNNIDIDPAIDPKINKHSLCLLYGILEDTDSPEYDGLRGLIQEILEHKRHHSDEPLTEKSHLIVNFNRILFDMLHCMQAVIAGSGTYMGDDSDGKHILCLNSKSGHYKPSVEDIEALVERFHRYFPKRDWKIYSAPSPTTTQLEKVFKHDAEQQLGTCFTDEEYQIAHKKKSPRQKTVKSRATKAVDQPPLPEPANIRKSARRSVKPDK